MKRNVDVHNGNYHRVYTKLTLKQQTKEASRREDGDMVGDLRKDLRSFRDAICKAHNSDN